MKRSFIIAILALVGVSLIWIVASRRDNPETEQPAVTTESIEAQPADSLPATPETIEEQPVDSLPAPVLLDIADREALVNRSRVSFGNIELRVYWGEAYSESKTEIVRYVDGVETDTATVIGECNGLRSDGRFCRLMWGIDSRTIDLTKRLPKTFNMSYIGVVPGCKFRSWSESGILVSVKLPDPAPDWILNKISEDVQPIVNYFDEESGKDSTVLKCDGSPDFFDRMLRYYYDRFQERRSRQAEREGEYFNCGSSYGYYTYPVWIDKNHSRITYRTYGRQAGGYSDYYSTYDIATGRLLGIEDLLSEQEMDKAVEELELDWYCYALEESGRTQYDPNGRRYADFGDNYPLKDTSESQVYKGKLYPRPAFTRHGVVFSYSMYTHGGCTADGVRHFVVPYQKLR